MESITEGLNWFDAAIILLVLFFIIEGIRQGFWKSLADFLAFLGAVTLAFLGYQRAAGLIQDSFPIAPSFANAFGFLAVAVLGEVVLNILLLVFVSRLPRKWLVFRGGRTLAALPAAGQALVLAAFFLTLVIGLPLNPQAKKAAMESYLGNAILKHSGRFENSLNRIFGGAVEDTLMYLTVKPQSNERVSLPVEIEELTIDEAAESAIFGLVNEERQKEGLAILEWAPEALPVARIHATDMWQRKYFAHISPEGRDVGDRLETAGVLYFVAGENLALAPTVRLAHNGLMNSSGHRANILHPSFRKMAVGVIDNGIYGKMFVQIFIS